MNYTTTLTSKNQITLPKSVRDRLGIKPGIKLDIYPTKDGFVGRLKRKSRIFDFFGDLKGLDDDKPLNQIKLESQQLAAQEIVHNLK